MTLCQRLFPTNNNSYVIPTMNSFANLPEQKHLVLLESDTFANRTDDSFANLPELDIFADLPELDIYVNSPISDSDSDQDLEFIPDPTLDPEMDPNVEQHLRAGIVCRLVDDGHKCIIINKRFFPFLYEWCGDEQCSGRH